jgi:hypothetical protein
MDLTPFWKLQLISHFTNSHGHPIWFIKSWLEFLCTTLLQRTLYIWLQPEKHHVPCLEGALDPVSICIYLLLVLGRLQVILKRPKNILALLNPVFGLGSYVVPKCQVYKGWGIISI